MSTGRQQLTPEQQQTEAETALIGRESARPPPSPRRRIFTGDSLPFTASGRDGREGSDDPAGVISSDRPRLPRGPGRTRARGSSGYKGCAVPRRSRGRAVQRTTRSVERVNGQDNGALLLATAAHEFCPRIRRRVLHQGRSSRRRPPPRVGRAAGRMWRAAAPPASVQIPVKIPQRSSSVSSEPSEAAPLTLFRFKTEANNPLRI